MLKLDISNIESQELLDYLEKNVLDYSIFEIALLFRSDYNQGAIIRKLILFLLDKAGIEPMWKNRFALIGDELINNSIEYGSLPTDKNIFMMKTSKGVDEFNIILEVQDTGKGLMAKSSVQMEQLRKEREEEGFELYLAKRGRGLFKLITSMVDDLYFKDAEGGGLIVGINKRLNLADI